jgi:hypothetical protein
MNKTKLIQVMNDLRHLTESLQAFVDTLDTTESADVVRKDNPVKLSETKPIEKKITLEQVRAVLAEKSRDGFTAEVRALLEKHGANKLSEIDPANYAALLENAEGLK